MLIGLIILYSLIIIPFRIGFQVNPTFGERIFDIIVDLLFFLDIIVAFNTAYVDESTEIVITDRKKIALNYLRLWFWIDIGSTIPFDSVIAFFMGHTGSGALSTLRLIKIFRLVRMLKLLRVFKLTKVGRLIEALNINPAFLGVQKLLLQICFMAHLVACFWHFITTSDVRVHEDYPRYLVENNNSSEIFGSKSQSTGITWTESFGYMDKPKGAVYVASFYWTISTMLSIGYGDIRGTNKSERLFCIATMLLGGVMFGAVISQVTRLIESRNPQAKAFKEKMDELKAYLNEKHLPNKLKNAAKVLSLIFLVHHIYLGSLRLFPDQKVCLCRELHIYRASTESAE